MESREAERVGGAGSIGRVARVARPATRGLSSKPLRIDPNLIIDTTSVHLATKSSYRPYIARHAPARFVIYTRLVLCIVTSTSFFVPSLTRKLSYDLAKEKM